jgi:protein-L-isoaspartate O-methyltransferase
MSHPAPDDLAGRIERLADRLAESGDLADPRWRAALLAVPRHLFVPQRAWVSPNGPGEPHPVDRVADPGSWWDAVYDDTVLVTQFDDGAGEVTTGEGLPTSSNSAPGAVFAFLEQLWVHQGNRVLEIGTGTGWTAALLAHRLGAAAVTSVEIDPGVAARARENLAAAGYQPRLVVGDGADGYPEGGPYDRVHVTCAVRHIPYAWVEQTRPGGTIVTPYSTGYGFGHLVRLAVAGEGRAVGRFLGPAGYMMLRSQRPTAGPAVGAARHEAGERSATGIDPRSIAWESDAADIAIGALAPGCQYRLSPTGDGDGSEGWIFWLLENAGHQGAWAKVVCRPGRAEFEVTQYGPRRLWDEVARAYLWWVGQGRPERGRFGITVSPGDQYVWLDHPRQALRPGHPFPGEQP